MRAGDWPDAAIRILCVIALVAMPLTARSAPPVEHDITVQVKKTRSAFEINFEFTVAATQEETWNVLTDYEHMAQILSNVDSSQVVSRSGNHLEVAQKSHASVGPIHFSVDGLRAIVLTPFQEIRSRQVKGDLKAMEFTTRLSDEGTVTRVTGNGSFVPSAWAAWAISAETVEAQTRRQYQELRAEILIRKTR